MSRKSVIETGLKLPRTGFVHQYNMSELIVFDSSELYANHDHSK